MINVFNYFFIMKNKTGDLDTWILQVKKRDQRLQEAYEKADKALQELFFKKNNKK